MVITPTCRTFGAARGVHQVVTTCCNFEAGVQNRNMEIATNFRELVQRLTRRMYTQRDQYERTSQPHECAAPYFAVHRGLKKM